MTGLGWAALAIGGLFAVAAVTSSSSGGGGGGKSPPTTPDDTARFSIKRNTALAVLPITDFRKGDVLNVVIHDSKHNLDIPALVQVESVTDGLQTVFSAAGFAGLTMLYPEAKVDLPPDGMNFSVFPADVVLRRAAPGSADVGLTHTLTDADVALGPNTYAIVAGFGSSKEFIDANMLAFSDVPYTVGDPTEGLYTTSIPPIEQRRLMPWKSGIVVNTKRTKAVLSIPYLSTALGRDSYGGSGYGSHGYGRGRSNHTF